MSDPYRRLSHREIYRNPWIVVEHHEIIHSTGVAGEHVLLVTPPASGVVIRDGDDLLFTVQPRFAVAQAMLEIVKGGAEPGESALAAARRELREEAGLTAASWRELGVAYELPSLMRHPVTLYLACDLVAVECRPEATEAITLRRIPRDKAVAQALSGEIVDAVTAVAILRANAVIANNF